MDITVRLATIRDLPALISLERACPTAAHWTDEQYREALQSEDQSARLILVAEDSPTDRIPQQRGEVLAFLVARQIAPEWELENVVVAPEHRRRGLGRQLVADLIRRARLTNSEAVHLEVRGSNAAARALYQELGFQQTGVRKSYYQNPLEDAASYCLHLD